MEVPVGKPFQSHLLIEPRKGREYSQAEKKRAPMIWAALAVHHSAERVKDGEGWKWCLPNPHLVSGTSSRSLSCFPPCSCPVQVSIFRTAVHYRSNEGIAAFRRRWEVPAVLQKSKIILYNRSILFIDILRLWMLQIRMSAPKQLLWWFCSSHCSCYSHSSKTLLVPYPSLNLLLVLSFLIVTEILKHKNESTGR